MSSQEPDLFHTIPSCSSSRLPTDGTPELWLTPLICAHINILWFLFKLRQSDASSPPSVVLSALQGCTAPPQRNALAAVYHWLCWEHLMAQSWWILWAVDLLIAVLSKAVNTQKVTSPFQRSPLHTDFLLRSCKWLSFCATGDFETVIDWIFVGDYITMTEPVRFVVAECGHLRLSRTSCIHHWGRGGLRTAVVKRKRGEAEGAWQMGLVSKSLTGAC